MRTIIWVPVIAAAWLAAAAPMFAQAERAEKAVAVINPTKGNQVHGTVTFTQSGDGIRVVADLEGLAPGVHGFHIHEYGDCSGADASSAGGHFNPHSLPHGGPDSTPRHTGDLGNLVADAQGRAHYDRLAAALQLRGPDNIIGRSVVVHENPDDYRTQPSGGSGARIACGVIGTAKAD
jgi:Cu-Zn family superoxide dismutase